MATTSLNGVSKTVDTSKDNVIIRNVIDSQAGGRSLDITDFVPTIIGAGHVLIIETATGNVKPMPVNAGLTAYAALPAGHTYFGIVIASELAKLPMVGSMLRGTVNHVAAPYGLPAIQAAVQAALPHILFAAD